MNSFITVICVFLMISDAYSQDHGSAIKEFSTLEEAQEYASQFREVSVGMINEYNDKYLFEEIDTSDMPSNIGKSFSGYGRTTCILKDTLIQLIEVEIIRFDLSKSSESTSDILLGQMNKRLAAGDTYWDVKNKFDHTSAWFYSGPISFSDIKLMHDFEDITPSENWIPFSNSNFKGMARIQNLNENVKAFYVIGYNSL